jgi:hypothetical protein
MTNLFAWVAWRGLIKMAEEPQNFVLEYLRRIDRKIDELQEGFRLFNVRVAATESHVSGLHVSDVQQNSEIDRIKQRLERIERRLELTEG